MACPEWAEADSELHFLGVFYNIYGYMNIDELKKLIKNSASVLVLDNGEPSFVIMDYKTYKDIASEKTGEKEVKIQVANGAVGLHNSREHETEILDRLNKEILALKAQIEMEEKGLGGQHID